MKITINEKTETRFFLNQSGLYCREYRKGRNWKAEIFYYGKWRDAGAAYVPQVGQKVIKLFSDGPDSDRIETRLVRHVTPSVMPGELEIRYDLEQYNGWDWDAIESFQDRDLAIKEFELVTR